MLFKNTVMIITIPTKMIMIMVVINNIITIIKIIIITVQVLIMLSLSSLLPRYILIKFLNLLNCRQEENL